jgi:hypothetical protein
VAIKHAIDLSERPALHSAVSIWYESPSGASLGQFLLDSFHFVGTFSLILSLQREIEEESFDCHNAGADELACRSFRGKLMLWT